MRYLSITLYIKYKGQQDIKTKIKKENMKRDYILSNLKISFKEPIFNQYSIIKIIWGIMDIKEQLNQIHIEIKLLGLNVKYNRVEEVN